MSIKLRPHQKSAIKNIQNAFQTDNKCLVKMFCGTGKTRIAFYLMTVEKTNLSVIVFPTISLITQFNTDYIDKKEWKEITKKFNYMSICSKNELVSNFQNIKYTTNEEEILNFIKQDHKKILCVTYQSLETFVSCVNKGKKNIDLIIYDEAHHIMGACIQKLAFGDEKFQNKCMKTLFLTATPKNDKGIVMLKKDIEEDVDYENIDDDIEIGETYESDCGILAFEYTHYQAVQDGICNDFDIAIDFYTDVEYKYKSTFSAIARCIFSTNNTKCLTFHSRSEVENSDFSTVVDFISVENKNKFAKEYNKVLLKEFENKKEKFKNKLQINGLTYKTKNKKALLDKFDEDDKNVHILASCNTIGEGIDTKNANIVCFVDPKNSFSTIIQNIGRVCRKQNKNSTVLLPCYVDAKKYSSAMSDEERDKVIREDMQENGNFTSILNVLSALKHNDPTLYDLCLKYPKKYAPKEVKENLNHYGYNIGKKVGNLIDTVNYITNNNFEDVLKEDQNLNSIGKIINKKIEIYTCDMKNPIKIFNNCEDIDSIKMYENNGEYRPVTGEGKKIQKPKRKPINIKCHSSKDIKILWNAGKDFKFDDKKVCQMYIESTKCEDNWFNNLKKCKEIITENKKRPSMRSKDKLERYLGSWLPVQIKNYREGKSSLDRFKREAMRIFLGEFGKHFEKVDIISKNFKIYQEFLDKNKKVPSETSKDKDEKYITTWFQNQKINYKNNKKAMSDKYPENRKLIEQFVEKNKKYFEVRDILRDNLKKCEEFILKNKRKPSQHSGDREEKKLGKWFSRQEGNCRQNKKAMRHPEKRRLFEEFVKKYKRYLTRDQKWADDIQRGKNFLDEYKRRPLPASEDEEERKIANWFGIKHKAYKAGIAFAKDPEKKKMFEDFVTDPKYAKYFSDLNNYIKTSKKSITKPQPSKITSKNPSHTPPILSQISELHKKYKTMTSTNLNELFTNSPNLWNEYHNIAEKNEKTFLEQDEIPYKRVINYLENLKTKQVKHIADLGCGKARISKHFSKKKSFKFYNYDHIAIDETVVKCDIKKLPLEDDSINIAILCLSMWGSNCLQYAKEAKRVLEDNGILLVCEPAKRWTDKENGENKLIKALTHEKVGFKLKTIINKDKFMFLEFVK